MKKNNAKTTGPVIDSREAMESVVGEIAALRNRQRLLTAEMDAQIQIVRERYEDQIASDIEAVDQKIEDLRQWSDANAGQFGAARSIETIHGTLGWRTGQPALKTVTGWTFDRVLQALKDAGAGDYIRVKEEVNKQHLLSDRDALGIQKLRDLGLRVVQEESFFVEPKLTTVEV